MIWIVTDHPLTKHELLSLVSNRGYAAEHVDCVTDVPRRARFRRPAMLILDCGVAESFELVTTLRGDPATAPIPLVMFTTADDSHRAEALARGADAFVQKRSLDWSDLLDEIERLVGPPPGPDHPRREGNRAMRDE